MRVSATTTPSVPKRLFVERIGPRYVPVICDHCPGVIGSGETFSRMMRRWCIAMQLARKNGSTTPERTRRGSFIAALINDAIGRSRMERIALVRATVDLAAPRVYITLVHRCLSALFLLLICASAMAQSPTTQPAPITPPTTGAATEEMVRLQYPNADVKDVLALYERLTGKRVVYDNSVQGNVNIVVNAQVPRTEAIKIIEINFLLNGFSLVPEDDHIIKVVGIGKIPRTAAVPIFSDLDQLPDTERVVTFMFRLQFADPTELQQTLFGGQYIAPTSYTNAVALPKAQALLVTESVGVIRTLAKVIKEIDVPPAEVVSEFIKLERADAKDVLEKLDKIFEKQQNQAGTTTTPGAPGVRQTTTTTEVAPQGAPPAAPSVTIENPATGLSEESIVIGKIRLTADVRTNRIHVITRPINLPFIRRLIQEFDSDVPFGEPAKRVLKFVSASDVLDIVVKAITEPGVKPEEATTATGNQATNRNNPVANTGGSTSFGGSSGGGGFNVSEELSTQPVDTTPKAVTVGNTKIIADPRE